MKVKIIRGTFGAVQGGRVKAVTAADGPITVADDIGARLIRCGVAEQVESEKPAAQPCTKEPEKAEPTYSARDSRAKLLEAAEAMGISKAETKKAGTKRELLELLDAYAGAAR